MKKSFILMLFSVLLSNFCLQGQTAVLTQTGCNSINVSMTGGCFGFVGAGNQANNGDWYYNTYSSKTYRLLLTKKQSGGTFAAVESAFDLSTGASYSWTNLPDGEYQVATSVYICTTQSAFTAGGSRLGFRVILSPGATSNVVTVGQTQESDISYSYLDANGSTIFSGANGSKFFAPNEEVRINTSASKNYDRYLMAIQEFLPDGTQGRWRALGNDGYGGDWIQGQMPTVISLTNTLWKINGTSDWEFLTGFSYRLQIVVSKSICPSWTQSLEDFYICQAGWGCREGSDKKAVSKIMLSPNPASNKFRIDGIDFSGNQLYQVSISDISGKELERFNTANSNEFMINSLSNGIYIVNVISDNKRLFSSKLVVNN